MIVFIFFCRFEFYKCYFGFSGGHRITSSCPYCFSFAVIAFNASGHSADRIIAVAAGRAAAVHRDASHDGNRPVFFHDLTFEVVNN